MSIDTVSKNSARFKQQGQTVVRGWFCGRCCGFFSPVHRMRRSVLTRAQKEQGTPFPYYPFDPPSNKVPQIVEIIMLEYLREPRNF